MANLLNQTRIRSLVCTKVSFCHKTASILIPHICDPSELLGVLSKHSKGCYYTCASFQVLDSWTPLIFLTVLVSFRSSLGESFQAAVLSWQQRWTQWWCNVHHVSSLKSVNHFTLTSAVISFCDLMSSEEDGVIHNRHEGSRRWVASIFCSDTCMHVNKAVLGISITQFWFQDPA